MATTTQMLIDNIDLLDDDSENDSDYVGEEEEGEDVDVDTSAKIGSLNSRRKRKAEDLWEEMQQADQQYVSLSMSNSLPNGLAALERPNKRTRRRAERFLQAFLGKSSRKPHSFLPAIDADPLQDKQLLREQLQKAVERLSKKVTVDVKRKFAGKEITVKSTVMSADPAASAEKPAGSSLDQALQMIKGPQTISTVSKSSMDWEQFKEKEGLQDDLAHSKEKYLERKDFLDRCDYKQFEQERDDRLAKQAQRQNQ